MAQRDVTTYGEELDAGQALGPHQEAARRRKAHQGSVSL
jgi:hypothetical protein